MAGSLPPRARGAGVAAGAEKMPESDETESSAPVVNARLLFRGGASVSHTRYVRELASHST
jgi:hypothetical protein